MKQHHYAALIGVGAVLVLVYLWYESQQSAAQATSDTASGAAAPNGAQTYPQAAPQPIQLGDVNVGGSQTYNIPINGNPFNPVQIGSCQSDCGCNDDDCAQAGVPVTVQTIQQAVLTAVQDNLKSYQSKTAYATMPASAASAGVSGNGGAVAFSSTGGYTGGGSFAAV